MEVCCGLLARTFEKFAVGVESLLKCTAKIRGLLTTMFEKCM